MTETSLNEFMTNQIFHGNFFYRYNNNTENCLFIKKKSNKMFFASVIVDKINISS